MKIYTKNFIVVKFFTTALYRLTFHLNNKNLSKTRHVMLVYRTFMKSKRGRIKFFFLELFYMIVVHNEVLVVVIAKSAFAALAVCTQSETFIR